MKRIIDIFKKHRGYAYLKDLKMRAVHTDTLRKLLDDQVIEKVKPGLYKLTDMPIISEQSMIDINMAMPNSVVCLHSALSYYELTTTVPPIIMVALTRGNKPVKILYPPIKVFYFSQRNFVVGITEGNTKYGTFRIYDIEKTIVDCFRFRMRLGEDIALEGLKNYLSKPNFKMNKILDYAKEGRMYNVIKPYIEAFIS